MVNLFIHWVLYAGVTAGLMGFMSLGFDRVLKRQAQWR
jgi:hypothetical protein